MFLQKQTTFQGRWEVTLDYPSPQEDHEAGTAVWWSKYAYASVGIRGAAGGAHRILVFRSPDPEHGDENKFIVSRQCSLAESSSSSIAGETHADPVIWEIHDPH